MADWIEVRQSSYGQKITLKTGIDISGQSAMKFLFKPPTGNEVHVTASCDDESAGEVYWITTSGFFTQTGEWKVLARLTFSSDSVLYTRPVNVLVVDRFET